MPAEMNHCIQTDHFLSAVVSQHASLTGQMGLTPEKRAESKKGHDWTVTMTNSNIEQPVDGDISVKSSWFGLSCTDRLVG